MYASAAKWTQMTTERVRRAILKSLSTRSTSSIPSRFATFATQKKSPLMITEGIPDFSISTKARETKLLQPARRTTMRPIRIHKFWRMVRYFEAVIRVAAISPNMLRTEMSRVWVVLTRLLRNVPRLLKSAEERLAASPMRAVSFPLSPCPLKMMLKRAPQVQLIPRMLPQATIQIMVLLYFLYISTVWEIKLCWVAGSSDLESSTMRFLSLRRRRIVAIADTTPTTAIIPLSSLILPATSYLDR